MYFHTSCTPKKKKINVYINIYIYIFLFFSSHTLLKTYTPSLLISLTQLATTQLQNLKKKIKIKIKNHCQPNIRVLALGVLNAKYLVLKTQNTKNTIVPSV